MRICLLLSLLSLCHSPDPSPALAFAYAFKHLRPSVLSPYQHLRLAALRFLVSSLVSRTSAQERLLQKCLDAEKCALDFSGAKERAIKLELVGMYGVPSKPTSRKSKSKSKKERKKDTADEDAMDEGGQDDDDAEEEAEESDNALVVDVALTWLLAQLQVNIRPLWAPAVKAIAALVERVPVPGWEMLMAELTKAANAAQLLGAARAKNRSRKGPRPRVEADAEMQEEMNVGVRKRVLESLGVLLPEWNDEDEDGTTVGLGVGEESEKEKTWRDADRTRVRGVCHRWAGTDDNVDKSRLAKVGSFFSS